MERLDSDSLHALFDNYTTKSERKKRKKSEESKAGNAANQKKLDRTNKETKNANKRINYECDKRSERHERDYVPSPQKRPAPSQAGSPSKKTKPVKCKQCGLDIEVNSKYGESKYHCKAGMCRPR